MLNIARYNFEVLWISTSNKAFDHCLQNSLHACIHTYIHVHTYIDANVGLCRSTGSCWHREGRFGQSWPLVQTPITRKNFPDVTLLWIGRPRLRYAIPFLNQMKPTIFFNQIKPTLSINQMKPTLSINQMKPTLSINQIKPTPFLNQTDPFH